MGSVIKNIFFKGIKITTFFISRIPESGIEEKVFLKNGKHHIDITRHQGMICLDPFCISVWLSGDQIAGLDPQTAKIQFEKGNKPNAAIAVSLIEKIATAKGVLLLYKIEHVKNYQLNALHRLVLFRYFLRSKSNTYYSRKVISALYSYPRRIIIVSYKDEEYYNIFPMDIQSYIQEDNTYILGLK